MAESKLTRGIFPPRKFHAGTLELSAFNTEHWDPKKRKVITTMCVTTPDRVLPEIVKALDKGHAIILRDKEGKDVLYEREGRDKYEFIFFRTKQQDKIKIERFPWEVAVPTAEPVKA